MDICCREFAGLAKLAGQGNLQYRHGKKSERSAQAVQPGSKEVSYALPLHFEPVGSANCIYPFQPVPLQVQFSARMGGGSNGLTGPYRHAGKIQSQSQKYTKVCL